MSDGWHVVYTLPRREQGAAKRLRDQGFETFLPCFRRPQIDDEKEDDELPALFSRYLFTRPDERIWGAGRHVPEVVTVLRQTIPDRAIAHVKAITEKPVRATSDELPIFPNGARLLITDGPFMSFTGILRSTDPAKRLAVLDVMLGTVSVDLANVRLAG